MKKTTKITLAAAASSIVLLAGAGTAQAATGPARPACHEQHPVREIVT